MTDPKNKISLVVLIGNDDGFWICLSKGNVAFSYLFSSAKIGLAVCVSLCNVAPGIEEIGAREGLSERQQE